MTSAAGRVVRALLLGAVVFTGTSGVVTAADPSPAQEAASGEPSSRPTLSAQPSVITAAVQPGGLGTASLTLNAGVGLDIHISPLGLGQSPEDGSFSFLPAEDDTSPYTARPFLDVEPSRFRIEAGESKQVKVTIAMPSLPADGERFAILKVNGTPLPREGNVGLAIALGVSVLVTLPGTQTSVAGDLQDLAVGPSQAPDDDRLVVTGAVANTGNVHYGAAPMTLYHAATLRDAAGGVVATARQELLGNSIVPSLERQFALALQPEENVPAGRYTVEVETGLSDGTVLDAETLELDSAGISGPPGAAPATPVDDGPPWPALGLGVAVLLAALVALVAWRRRRPRPAA